MSDILMAIRHPGAQDLAENFAEHDPRWHPEVAAMLLTVKGL